MRSDTGSASQYFPQKSPASPGFVLFKAKGTSAKSFLK
jgi:hypothetical protein